MIAVEHEKLILVFFQMDVCPGKGTFRNKKCIISTLGTHNYK